MINEGFWKNKLHPEYPEPTHSDIEYDGKRDILDKLHMIETLCQDIEGYRGSSWCRCCDKPGKSDYNINGSHEYSVNGYSWPEGYKHYLEVHNVKPSDGFIETVLGLKI